MFQGNYGNKHMQVSQDQMNRSADSVEHNDTNSFQFHQNNPGGFNHADYSRLMAGTLENEEAMQKHQEALLHKKDWVMNGLN